MTSQAAGLEPAARARCAGGSSECVSRTARRPDPAVVPRAAATSTNTVGGGRPLGAPPVAVRPPRRPLPVVAAPPGPRLPPPCHEGRPTEHGRGSKGPTREAAGVQGRPPGGGPGPRRGHVRCGGATRPACGCCWQEGLGPLPGTAGLRVGWQACDSPHQEMRRVLQLQADAVAAACVTLKRDSAETMKARCRFSKDAPQRGAR